MTNEDFVRLPADLAAEVYYQFSNAGQSEKALELHQAYLKRHQVSLKEVAARTAKAEHTTQAVVSLARLTGNSLNNSVRRVLGSWKTCEYCQSRIKAAATVCRYCQRNLA